MERSFYELLSYLVSSALECADEPSPYGALRLMGGAERLLRFGLTHGLAQDPALEAMAQRIEAEKNCALTDPPRFRAMIEETALSLVAY